MGENRRRFPWWKLIFWLYVLFLVAFVVVKFDGHPTHLLDRMEHFAAIRAKEPGFNLNLWPLASIRMQIRHWGEGWAVKNLVGNVLAFVPFGFLLPQAYGGLRRLWRVMLIGLISICAIEVFQYVTLLGACDIDDLMLNLLGCLVGYLMFRRVTREETR